MSAEGAVFYVFAAITVLSGGVVVLARSLIYSAFALLFTFFGVAGLYVLLGADFLAATQLLIYVGGILVLLLFGVMLTHKLYDLDLRSDHRRHRAPLPQPVPPALRGGVDPAPRRADGSGHDRAPQEDRMTPAAKASLPPSGIHSREAEFNDAPKRGRTIR